MRAMAHRFNLGTLSLDDTKKLRGLLAFAISIEPEYVNSIIRMIGEPSYKILMRGN